MILISKGSEIFLVYVFFNKKR